MHMYYLFFSQDEVRLSKLMKERQLAARADPNKMMDLRMKFLNQCKKYFGVPYAKKYWKPEGVQL